ncbi:MAG: hypothetical protein WCJ30_12310 [Deltaproteobacteria bacterium]
MKFGCVTGVYPVDSDADASDIDCGADAENDGARIRASGLQRGTILGRVAVLLPADPVAAVEMLGGLATALRGRASEVGCADPERLDRLADMVQHAADTGDLSAFSSPDPGDDDVPAVAAETLPLRAGRAVGGWGLSRLRAWP